MHLTEQAQRLRIYIGADDKRHGKPLYELLIEEARRRKMAGATVLRGVAGFGANSLVHTAKILRLSEDLPLVVEIVDVPARIEAFLPYLDEVMNEGMATVEPAQVLLYRANTARKP